MRRFLFVFLILMGLSPLSRANQAVRGWCEDGAQPVVTSGLTSTTLVQASFPQCQVTVFLHGGAIATIYADNSATPTPLANPFTAQTNGQWLFYAPNGHYDVTLTFTGSNPPSPITYSDILVGDPANQQAALPCTTLTFSATPAFFATNNICYQMTLTANVTSSTITGTPANGNLLSFSLCQDGVGSHTFSFPSSFIIPAQFSFNTSATVCNYLTFKFDGTNWSFLTNSGSGGGGATPSPPNGALQKTLGTTLVSSSVVDNGTTVAVGEDAQFAGPNPYFDLRAFGGYSNASPPTTTGTISTTSTSLALASAQDFANGQGIVVYQAGALPTLPTPPTPAITVMGVGGGATTYNYQYLFEDFFGGLKAGGAQGSTTTGQASLGLTNFSLTQVVVASGVGTYTCTATCNVLSGVQANITGFSGATAAGGTLEIVSAPSSSTFTAFVPLVPDGTYTTGTVNILACNLVIPTGSFIGTDSTIMRTWVYRGGTLVGVANGQDPTYLDCGFQIDSRVPPSYVPTSYPGSDQAGFLATTIVSGGGTTTLTLANAATTSVTAQSVLHDNSKPLISAFVAAQTVGSLNGGQVYIPTGNWPFNATTVLPAPSNTGNGTNILQAGIVTASNPIVLARNTQWIGVAGAVGSFINRPQARIAGFASTLLLANGPTASSVGLSNLSLPASGSGQNALVLDGQTSGGGLTGFEFNNVSFSGLNASAVIIKGGFNFYFTNTTCSEFTGNWYTFDCVHSTSVSQYIHTGANQAWGRVYFNQFFCSGSNCVGVDFLPMFGLAISNFSSGGNVFFKEALHESITGPFMRIGLLSSAPGQFHFEQIEDADPATSVGTPMVDASLTTNLASTISNSTGFGETALLQTSAGTSLIKFTSVVCFNLAGLNCTNQGAIGLGIGGISLVSNVNNPPQQLNLFANSTLAVPMATPAAPTSCAVSAGGSVPVGTFNYTIQAIDTDGNVTVQSPNCVAVTTSGNQTVTIVPPTLPAGATSYWPLRNGARIQLANCNVPILPSVNSVDNVAIQCGNGSSAITTAARDGLSNANGFSASRFRLVSNPAGFPSIFVSNATASRTVTFPDATGTVPLPNLAQTWTATQTLNNSSQLRFLSTNGTNYAGFQGGASTTNLIWLFPTTDSTGTQCLSSNGSLQLAWSNCSGGTGTPGGATTQVQYNNAGSFGGSTNLTWVSPALTIGVAATTTGQLVLQNGGASGVGATVQNNAATVAYNFNLPSGAGTSGQPLLSGGGAAAAMTFGTLGFSGGGTNQTTFTANQLVTDTSGSLASLAGTLTGTNPVLTLTAGSASAVPLTLNTASTPTGDIFDLQINGTKTSFFDSGAFLHVPQVSFNGSNALILSATNNPCTGAQSGVTVLCLGDNATSTAQLSLTGRAFKSIPQWTNTGPTTHSVLLVSSTFPEINFTNVGTSGQALVSGGTSADPSFGTLGAVGGGTGNTTNTAHGVMLGEGTSALNVSAAGTSGQAFLSGGASADGAYAAINLAGGSSILTGILPVGNGGTGSSTLAGANIVTVTGAITTAHCVQWSSATVVTDSGAGCGGAGGASRLDQITAATSSPAAIDNSTFGQEWDWDLTGSQTAFKFSEKTASTGTGNKILLAHTLSASTAAPFQADSNGIGWQVNSSGNLLPVSTASAAIPGTAHGIVLSEGASTVIATTGAGTSGQILTSSGSSSDPAFKDFPDYHVIPAANCNNTSGGAGWSIGSGGTVTCRAGTNNKGGFIVITDTSSTFATFQVAVPEDWDTGSNPFIRFQISSTDTTSGHTIIPSIQVACYKGDGSTTDDVAANAAHSLSTITLNTTANQFWSSSNVQMNSTDVTGCVAGAMMQVTVGRATDTATNAQFYSATITFPRLLSVQAN